MAEALDVQLRADASAFNRGISDAIGSLNRLTSETRKIGNSTQQMASGFQKFSSTVSSAFKGLAAGIAVGGIVAALQQVGQAMVQSVERAENFRASIDAITNTSSRGADAMTKVYQSAKRLGAGVDDVAATFKNMTIALEPLGATNSDIQRLTETMFKLGRIGGQSMSDIAEVTRQLGQAMSAGRLNGDELRIMLERFPLLARAIAQEMGVATGALKKLGAEGKIGPEVVLKALQNMEKEVNDKFSKMPLTIGQAMNNIQTSISKAFDNPVAIAAVRLLAQAINGLAVVISAIDSKIRLFATNISRIFAEIARAVDPVVQKVAQLGQSFSGIGGIIGGAVSTIPSILLNAFVGPIGAIILNWDRVRAYFANQVPAMFYGLIGAAQDAMATVVSIFQNAWNAIIGIVQNAVNTIIAGINSISGATNSMLGTDFIPKIDEVNLKTKQMSATITGWKDAASRSYAEASAAAQRYQTDIRTISRVQAEQAALAEAGTNATNNFADSLNKVSTAAGGVGGGAGGGGKGGGGGAAGGIKKAGDAAKKMASDMDQAKSQVEEFGQAMQGIAQSLGSGVVDALFSIAEGSKSAKEAFTELAKSMLKQIAQMIMQLLILKPLMSMFGMPMTGGGGGIGLFSGGAATLGTFSTANSRTAIGSYQGFAPGPSVMQAVRSSSVTASSSKPLMVSQPITINNNSDAVVRTRQDQTGTIIDIAIEAVTDQIVRGGNRLDQAMSRAYGARRVGY